MTHPSASTEPEGSDDVKGGYGTFAHLGTSNAVLYRRVMRALMAEKERFAVHVRPDQVGAALDADGGEPVGDAAVTEALERLAQPSWGNLLAFPDSSRVTALGDFYRRRMLYQISRQGGGRGADPPDPAQPARALRRTARRRSRRIW